jgi:uncharacterized protein YaaR (DUF327 family)
MPVKNISETDFAKKWGDRLKGATSEIRDAVQKLDKDPGALAIAQQEKLLAKVTEAIKSGKWAKKRAKVTLDDWKKAMLNKGIPNISTGVDNATSKVQDFAKKLLEYEKSQITEIDKLPTVTLEDSIRKMTEWVRRMAKFSYE